MRRRRSASVVQFYALLMPSVLIYHRAGLADARRAVQPVAPDQEQRADGHARLRHQPAAPDGADHRRRVPVASLIVGAVNETIGPWSAYWTQQFVKLQRHKGDCRRPRRPKLGLENEVAAASGWIDKFDTQTFEMANVT